MEILGQGLVLMAAGMGIVFCFLCVLVVVARATSSFVARFDHILPDGAPKKAPARQSGDDSGNIALAIAVALSR